MDKVQESSMCFLFGELEKLQAQTVGGFMTMKLGNVEWCYF